MGIIERPFKFKIIKNFIDKSEINLLNDYGRIKHRINFNNFDLVQSNNCDTYFYGDPLTDALMIGKREIMEKETGYKLLPTYSYWRMYTYNAELTKHTDRPSCEVSVTVSIASDGTKWPIFMDGQKVELEHGDAAIYFGCEVEHWREPFTGDWHLQSFLHYVNAEGPNASHFKDNRAHWGLQARMQK